MLRVLLLTSEWPTPEAAHHGAFVVQQADYLRRAGVDLSVYAFRGQKNPLRYAFSYLEVRRLYDLDSFDLIHAHFGQSGLLALFSRRPLVVTFHGSEVQGIVGPEGRYTAAGWLLQQVSSLVAHTADELIAVSERVCRYLPAEREVHVIPGGVNFELFRPLPRAEARAALNLPPDRLLVLFAADPARPVKRYRLAQTAVALLGPGAALVVMSNVPHEMVPLYMSACDVLVLTSKHEGSPTVVKEALACNLPIVAVDVGDVRERISDIDGCIVCDDDRPETIAAGLRCVLERGQRTRSRDLVGYLDEEKIVQRILDVYRSALGEAEGMLTGSRL
ncbi:MAG: glycosyltransferase [Candidatus Promineifilaceae bacterium]|nr:glycosyltransferase [Candidatus Promineifilaceae bacterium]